jgi:hypothetical protein
VANERRRKKMILHMEEGGRNIGDPKEIQETIYKFYKNLFGKQPVRKVFLAEGISGETDRLSREGNSFLTRPFNEEEVQKVIADLKASSAPRPDGFSYNFCKSCCNMIRGSS